MLLQLNKVDKLHLIDYVWGEAQVLAAVERSHMCVFSMRKCACVCLKGMETSQLSHSVKSLYTFGRWCWQVIQSSEAWTACQKQICFEQKGE